MSNTKKAKPVKAWALIWTPKNKICHYHCAEFTGYSVHKTRQEAIEAKKQWFVKNEYKIVPILINEIRK